MPQDFSDAAQYGLSVSTQEPTGSVPKLDVSDAGKFGLTVSAKEPNGAQALDLSDAGKFGLSVSTQEPGTIGTPDGRLARVPGDALIRNEGQIPTSPMPVAGGMNVTGVAPHVPDVLNPGKGGQLAVEGFEQMAEPDAAEKLRGLGKVGIGSVQAASPVLTLLGAAAPLESLAWVGIGQGIGAGAGEIARRSGASPEDAREIDEAASLLPMAFGIARSGLRAIAENRAATQEAIAQHFENQATTRPGAQSVDVTVANPQTGKLESTPVVMGGEERIPVTLKSPKGPRPAFIEALDDENFQVVDAKTGKIIQAGRADAIATALRRDAVDPSWLDRLRQASGVQQLGTESPVPTPETTEMVRESEILGGKQNGAGIDTSDAGQFGVKVTPEEPAQAAAPAAPPQPVHSEEAAPSGVASAPTVTPVAQQLQTLKLQGDDLRNALADPQARSHVVGTAVSWWLGGQNAQHASVPLMKQLLAETLPGGALEELHPGSVTVYRGHGDGTETARAGVSSFSVDPSVAEAYANAPRHQGAGAVRQMDVTPQTPAIALDKLHQVVSPDFDFNAMQKAGLGADHEVIAMENHRGEVIVDEGRQAHSVQQDEEDERELAALEGEQPENAGAEKPATLETDSDELRGRGERGVSGAVAASPRQASGEETSVVVPGEDLEIGAHYAVRDLADLQPSHSGLSFQPNPRYEHHNERDYSKSENQQRIIQQSSEERFNPRYLITDNPDATNGPPVIDEAGNVLGGNSRAMTMQIVYGRNAKAAASYRALLAKQAAHYGIDPETLAHFREPVLVRVARGEDLAQLPGGSKWAIRKTNVAGTAALSASERAAADAGQLTPDIKAQIAELLEAKGPEATLSEALTGPRGSALVNQLIKDGFFSEQERPSLMDGKTGAITGLAKERIGKALLGEFFEGGSDQLQRFPASIKQKLERIAAPLAAVSDDPDWDLTPAVRQAVNLIEYSEAKGERNLDELFNQRSMFGEAEANREDWSPRAIALARLLREAKPNDLVSAFRQYAARLAQTREAEEAAKQDALPGMTVEIPPSFTPDEAFQSAFGGEEPQLFASLDGAEPLIGFYSQLERVIAEKMPAKVSPAQALAILQNPQHGVKADELKWTGLADWLKQQKGTLTRQQILQRANDDRVSVRESEMAFGKYSQYTLPGARKQYRELLFHWNPPVPETPEYRAYRQIFDRLEAKYGHQKYNPTPEFPAGWPWFADGASYYGKDPLTPEERHEYSQAVDAWDRESDYQNQYGGPRYHSPHFESKNVLAHARFDERTDSQGRRVLFIEEIQSDWHQEGRKRGYDENSRTAPGTHPHLVPDAPFRSTWHELVFRRLVRWAAQNGYDAIAWTTGKQQAERYDLAKHVSGIRFRTTDDEYLNARYNKIHTRGEGEPIGFLYTRRKPHRGEDASLLDWDALKSDPIRASDLPEYLGKELAKRLLAQPPAATGADGRHAAYQLTGDDLTVGGHGMSGFYDSILPAYAAKFGKRWGAKPELTKLDTTGEPTRLHHYEGPSYPIEQVRAALRLSRNVNGSIYNSPFTGHRLLFVFNRVDNSQALQGLLNHLEAGMPFHEAVDQTGVSHGLADLLGGKVREEAVAPSKKTEPVHALPITAQMRASVVEGQPLFAKPLSGSPYDPNHSYTNDEIVTAADWEMLPASDRRALRLRVNWQAGQVLAHVMRMGSFSGITLRSDALPVYAQRLAENAGDWLSQGALTVRAAQRMRELSEALLAMHTAANGRPVFIQRDRIAEAGQAPGTRMGTLRDQAATQREEQTHVQQAVFARALEGNGAPAHLTDAALRAVTAENADWPAIHAALAAHNLFYTRQPLPVQVLEAGAKLIAGRLDQLRVPTHVADQWLRAYYRALRATHGEENARQVFRYADKRFKLIPEEEEHGQRGPERQSDVLHPRSGHSDADQSARRKQGGKGAGRGSGEGEGGSDGLRDTAGEREPSLFGNEENDEVARTAARDRDQLAGERLSAQFNSPLTREEQRKKLKRSNENPQTDLFGENEGPPQGALFDRDGEKGSIDADLATLGLTQFVKQDVIPNARVARAAIAAAKDDLLQLLAPAARKGAAPAALSVRHRAAELQRATDRAEAALRIAKKYFDSQSPEHNFEFIDRMEEGRKQQTPELEAFAQVMREMLDTRREAIRALGKGKLEKFIENYFPHIWKKPGAAADFYANYGKRPLEGSKAFLKKRTIDSFAAGLEAGLEPISRNPVDLVLRKAREMDKYLTAQQIFDDLKEKGILRYVDAREGTAPHGWIKINDPSATVYGPSVQNISEYPNEGLWDALQKVAEALELKQQRGFLNLRGAIGRAGRDGSVRTLHGTAEDVLAHEIGHQIDFRAGSGKKFIEEYPDAETVRRLKRARKALKDAKLSTPEERKFARQELKDLAPAIQKRKAFAKELRDLADLRSGPTDYTHKREEKMAQLAEMWVGARELFQRTAPAVFQEWKSFLDANPKLHALRDIEGNTEVKAISQPYDVGGLVIRGHWWAPEPAARIVNNYLSPGLREKSGLFRAFMGLGNLLNQAQLGFSAFHLAFTSVDAATSKLALGLYQMGHGDFLKGLQSAAQTPLAPFTNIAHGDKLLKEWYGPGTQGERVAALVDAMMRAGGRAHMDSFYETKITEKMMQAFRAFNLPGALLRLPGSLLERAAKPILGYLVPRQKLGVFADIAAYELERLGPDADPEELQAALARAWDSVDNRLGQLVYDNLFWDRVVKDLALVSVRSVGWNVGTIREVAGAGPDTVRFLGEAAKGASGKGGNPDFTPRMSYAIALPLVAGLLGALMYYLWHGHAPKHLKDYFFPTDSHGHRWSLPTYMKDLYEYATSPIRTAEGKIHPLLATIWEMLENKDFYGKPIRNPHHSLVKQAEDAAEFLAKEFLPLSYRTNSNPHHHPSQQERLLGIVGVRPAPKSLGH
jgi:hypothetical protein